MISPYKGNIVIITPIVFYILEKATVVIYQFDAFYDTGTASNGKKEEVDEQWKNMFKH